MLRVTLHPPPGRRDNSLGSFLDSHKDWWRSWLDFKNKQEPSVTAANFLSFSLQTEFLTSICRTYLYLLHILLVCFFFSWHVSGCQGLTGAWRGEEFVCIYVRVYMCVCVYLRAGFHRGKFHLADKHHSWWRIPGGSSSPGGSDLRPAASEETQEIVMHSWERKLCYHIIEGYRARIFSDKLLMKEVSVCTVLISMTLPE